MHLQHFSLNQKIIPHLLNSAYHGLIIFIIFYIYDFLIFYEICGIIISISISHPSIYVTKQTSIALVK